MLKRLATLCLTALLLAVPSLASAQTILIDISHRRIVPPRPIPRPTPPPQIYKIKSVDIQATVKDQIAQIQLSQVFQNIGSTTLEAQLFFPLPDDAAVSGLTLLVDGKEFAGKLMKKEDARRIYEEIVRRQRDPALLEYMGHGLFQTSVFPIPAGAERTVQIKYQQLLKKDAGLVDLVLPIGTNKHCNHPVETLAATIRVETAEQIKTIYSPTHQVSIERADNTHAVCKLSLTNVLSQNDFRLMYGTTSGPVGINVLSYKPKDTEDGYFLLLASPEVKSAMADKVEKSVVLVLDRSGSMNGKKIEQAREALKFFINQLRPGDNFNIVAYDSNIEPFKPELQRVDDATIQSALGWADGIYAGGSTNIDGALTTALKMLNDPKRPSYVLFLTDGLPTVGELNEQKIAANAKAANGVNARLFTFGVGYDVNSRLLDRLSKDQRGLSAYVLPSENIEAHVSSLYNKISMPVMTDIGLNFEFDMAQPNSGTAPINRTYPRQLTDLFQGEQLVYIGRYKHAGTAKVTLTGHVGGEKKTFTFPATFEAKSGETNGFIEKLWAARRVGEIIDELDLKGQNQELLNELVELSIQHGIMTPYTSFLADDGVNLGDRPATLSRARDETMRELEKAEGRSGVAQRALKQNYKAADNLNALEEYSADFAKKSGPTSSPAGTPAPAERDAAASVQLQLGGKALRNRGVIAQDAQGNLTVIDTVRNVGQKTFFRRSNQWQDASVTEEQAKKARRVTQYSDEYFELANAHGGTLAKYLVFDEPVLVNLGKETIQIDPPADGD